MNQKAAINRALKLLKPVLISTQKRRPKGFTTVQADLVAAKLDRITDDLIQLGLLYENAEKRLRG